MTFVFLLFGFVSNFGFRVSTFGEGESDRVTPLANTTGLPQNGDIDRAASIDLISHI